MSITARGDAILRYLTTLVRTDPCFTLTTPILAEIPALKAKRLKPERCACKARRPIYGKFSSNVGIKHKPKTGLAMQAVQEILLPCTIIVYIRD